MIVDSKKSNSSNSTQSIQMLNHNFSTQPYFRFIFLPLNYIMSFIYYVITESKIIIKTILNYDLWLYIAWSDIKARYRRTLIGPFWLVIANAVTIIGMAIIWSLIFKMDIKEYFPKLTAAMITWSFISYTITEASTTFTQHYSLISNLPIPLYIFPLRIIMRNLITFAHNFLIYLLVILFFQTHITIYHLLFFPMMLLLLINFFFLSFTIGLVSARFRDLQQILTAMMSVLVLVTPVMWDTYMLGEYAMLANINPFTHILNIVKYPLMGFPPPSISTIFMFIVTLLNIMMMFLMSKKFKHRIAFWCN